VNTIIVTERDQNIISDYISGMTLKECASRAGVTSERVRQILRDNNVERRSPNHRGSQAYNEWVAINGDIVIAEMRRVGSVRQVINDLADTRKYPKAWLRRVASERISKTERLQHRRGPAYTDDQLITALQSKTDDGRLTSKQYEERREQGEPALATFVLRFGSWTAAVKAAGLTTAERPKTTRRWTEIDMLQAVRTYAELAEQSGQTPTVTGYSEWRRLQTTPVPSFSTMRFQSGRNWLDLLKAAGH
jgi:transcriptional regulator with XRE-family HTH domain